MVGVRMLVIWRLLDTAWGSKVFTQTGHLLRKSTSYDQFRRRGHFLYPSTNKEPDILVSRESWKHLSGFRIKVLCASAGQKDFF